MQSPWPRSIPYVSSIFLPDDVSHFDEFDLARTESPNFVPLPVTESRGGVPNEVSESAWPLALEMMLEDFEIE